MKERMKDKTSQMNMEVGGERIRINSKMFEMGEGEDKMRTVCI